MKRLTVDDDIKDLLADATKVLGTADKLGAAIDGNPAEVRTESSVLRLALHEFIQGQHEYIVELADALPQDGA